MFNFPIFISIYNYVQRETCIRVIRGSVFVPAAPAIAFLRIFPLFCLQPCFEAAFRSCDQEFFLVFLSFFTFYECFFRLLSPTSGYGQSLDGGAYCSTYPCFGRQLLPSIAEPTRREIIFRLNLLFFLYIFCNFLSERHCY